MATRDAGGAVINALSGIVTNLVGGSADLDPSTRTADERMRRFPKPACGAVRRGTADTGDRRRRLGVSQDGTFISACASTRWRRR